MFHFGKIHLVKYLQFLCFSAWILYLNKILSIEKKLIKYYWWVCSETGTVYVVEVHTKYLWKANWSYLHKLKRYIYPLNQQFYLGYLQLYFHIRRKIHIKGFPSFHGHIIFKPKHLKACLKKITVHLNKKIPVFKTNKWMSTKSGPNPWSHILGLHMLGHLWKGTQGASRHGGLSGMH